MKGFRPEKNLTKIRRFEAESILTPIISSYLLSGIVANRDYTHPSETIVNRIATNRNSSCHSVLSQDRSV